MAVCPGISLVADLHEARFILHPLHTLVQLGQHDPSQVGASASYTLHSCKASYLSYMNEVGVARELRRLQGHHKGQAVELCSRGDTIAALRAQRFLLHQVRAGWVPSTPIVRGAQRPLVSSPPNLVATFEEHGSLPVMFQTSALHAATVLQPEVMPADAEDASPDLAPPTVFQGERPEAPPAARACPDSKEDEAIDESASDSEAPESE